MSIGLVTDPVEVRGGSDARPRGQLRHRRTRSRPAVSCQRRGGAAASPPEPSAFVVRNDAVPTTIWGLRQMLARVRRLGIAEEDGDITAGCASVAVAVRDHAGHPVAAVALIFPSAKLGPVGREVVSASVSRTAAEIGRRLAARSSKDPRALSRDPGQGYVATTDPVRQPVDRDVGPDKRSLRMYARVVVYTHQDDKVELEAKSRAGVIPIVTSTPGYISYGVMFEDEKVVSISQWQSEEHAKVADAAIAEWVKANTTMTSETGITGDLAWLELASS